MMNNSFTVIDVTISQTLSCNVTIEIPPDLDLNSDVLKKYVKEQILLPSNLKDLKDWNVDDFCVMT